MKAADAAPCRSTSAAFTTFRQGYRSLLRSRLRTRLTLNLLGAPE
jgi:hypothetical protein